MSRRLPLTGLEAGVLQVVHVPGISDVPRPGPPAVPAEGAGEGDGVVLGRAAAEGALAQAQLLAVTTAGDVVELQKESSE